MPKECIVSEFAKSQLRKSGWVQGKGLGRKEDGISEPLKVKIKADNAGVGHDPGEQFTFHWWDHAFRKSAQNINVTEGQNEVTIKAVGETEKASATKKDKKLLKEKILYGGFVKSGTLQNGKMHKKVTEHSDCETSDSECDTPKKLVILTDEQLLAACGGRTAHKGARHGLKLSAKLARLQEQESDIPENVSTKTVSKKRKKKKDSTNHPDELNSSPKLKKKCKRSKEEMTEPPLSTQIDEVNDNSCKLEKLEKRKNNTNGDVNEVCDERRRKKKKKKRNLQRNENSS